MRNKKYSYSFERKGSYTKEDIRKVTGLSKSTLPPIPDFLSVSSLGEKKLYDFFSLPTDEHHRRRGICLRFKTKRRFSGM